MKRLLSAALIGVLLLCSCTPKEDQTPDADSSANMPEGLYVYHNIAQSYKGGGDYKFGLLNTKGEFVLPMEYDLIEPASMYDYTDSGRTTPAADRFFFAYQYTHPEYDENNPIPEDPVEYDPYDGMAAQALISPEGKLLTGFDYYNIRMFSKSPVRFVAVKTSDTTRFVELDREGKESELSVSQDVRELIRQYIPLTGEEEPMSSIHEIFEHVVFLENGNFWGATSPHIDEDGDEILGKTAYMWQYRLYDDQGNQLGDDWYHQIYKVGTNLYCGDINYEEDENFYSAYFLFDGTGKMLEGPLDELRTYHNPYVIIRQGGTVQVILDNATDGIQVLTTFDMGPTAQLSSFNIEESCVVGISETGKPMTVHIVTYGTGGVSLENLTFSNLVGPYMLDYTNEDMTRFLISNVGYGKGDYSVALYDREGNVLMDGFDSLYHNQGVLMSYRSYEDESGNYEYATYICDWDGNVLLGEEYSVIEPQPGYTALVVKGDTTGLIDYEGNWIYSESVFQSLES